MTIYDEAKLTWQHGRPRRSFIERCRHGIEFAQRRLANEDLRSDVHALAKNELFHWRAALMKHLQKKHHQC